MNMATKRLIALGCGLLLAAGAGPAEGADDPHEVLMQLSQEYWEAHLWANPVSATAQGDRRYDHRLNDISPEGIETRRKSLEDLYRRALALDADDYIGSDHTTLRALRFELITDLATLSCGFETWNLTPMSGPQISFFNIPSFQPLTDAASGKAMLQRWEAMAPYIDQHVANLRRGLAEGRVATADAVIRILAQLDDLAATETDEWALLKPVHEMPAAWKAADESRFREGMTRVVTEEIRPALMRYRDVLRDEVLPAARGQDRPGIMHVAGGRACYENMIYRHTSLKLSPEDIHEIGLEEVARINRETRALGKKVFGIDDLAQIQARLRSDPAMYFSSRDEVEEKAREALARAREQMKHYFGIQPQARCEVVRMEAHEEKYSTIAYYRRPAVDGSRPGSYYINTYAPETRPRYEAEALAFHEAIPGHHLQIAIQQELDTLPEFRKHSGVTAYVEGWGLYSERLAEEMGLYSGDVDRLGMLSYDSWRACRLVVDTGMHALGWTRQQAIDYMLANSVLAENNIVNEVDRYIGWPGQALAYKLGQREIFRLRADARRRLGDRFDLKGFHDAVLQEGAVDLETLAVQIDHWVRSRGGTE